VLSRSEKTASTDERARKLEEHDGMKRRHSMLPAALLGFGLFLTGCASQADNTRNRTDNRMADHTGAMGGTGGVSGSQNSDLDQRSRPGSETGMNSGDRSTTGGGTSSSGSERGNNPNRSDQNR
jgi:hypothetical protein